LVIGQFHNYHNLIDRHKRSFSLAHKLAPARNPVTSKMVIEVWDNPVNIQGALWFVTNEDLKKYPDEKLSLSDMKLITSTTLLNGFIPKLIDKLEIDSNIYYIKKIIKQVHYGNYYIMFLSKEYKQIS
jgi:hypothetical protein